MLHHAQKLAIPASLFSCLIKAWCLQIAIIQLILETELFKCLFVLIAASSLSLSAVGHYRTG